MYHRVPRPYGSLRLRQRPGSSVWGKTFLSAVDAKDMREHPERMEAMNRELDITMRALCRMWSSRMGT